ncbi:MAG: DUF4271 domain-containing protein [Flavobacteriales bacterium]
MEPALRSANYIGEVWMILLLCASLILYAFVRVNYQSYFLLLKNGVINYRLALQDIRESPVLSRRGLVYMIPFALIFWALASWGLIQSNTSVQEHSLSLIKDIFIVVAGCYVMKIICIRMVEGLLGAEYGLEEYLFNIIYFLELGSVLGFPLLILGLYGPIEFAQPIFISLGIVAVITYVWRVLRGIVSAFRYNAPLQYIILYLCTLEILPLLVLSKLILNRLN